MDLKLLISITKAVFLSISANLLLLEQDLAVCHNGKVDQDLLVPLLMVLASITGGCKESRNSAARTIFFLAHLAVKPNRVLSIF